MAANELPRKIEVPGFVPETTHRVPWERLQDTREWKDLIQKIKKQKRKGNLMYEGVNDEFVRKAAWEAYGLRAALMRIAKAKPGDIIDIAWMVSYPDQIRIAPDGTMRFIRDVFYEHLLEMLDGRNSRTIGQCGECGRLFLRKRKNQVVCSPGCRVRRTLNRFPDKRLALEARRAQKEQPLERQKREKLQKKLELEGQPKGILTPHKRCPRPI